MGKARREGEEKKGRGREGGKGRIPVEIQATPIHTYTVNRKKGGSTFVIITLVKHARFL